MALDSYTNLQQAVAGELNRADLSLVIPDFITRFEARARRELKDYLRTTLLLTGITGDTALPATVGDVLSAAYNDGTAGAHNFPLDLLSRNDYQAWMEQQSSPVATAGQMAYVDADTVTGVTTLRFWPPATASGPIANLSVEVVGYLPALSGTQATNALLRDAPDLYLKGACAEAAQYLAQDERVAGWASERDAGFRSLRIQTERRLYGGTPRRRSLPRVFG